MFKKHSRVNFRTIAGAGKDDSKRKRMRKGLEKVHTVRISISSKNLISALFYSTTVVSPGYYCIQKAIKVS